MRRLPLEAVLPTEHNGFANSAWKILRGTWRGMSIVIFDSLSTFISTVGEERALRLIPSVVAKVRQHGSAVVSLTSGIHSESTLAQLNSLFDLIVEMKIEAGEHLERMLRITKYRLGSHPDRWIPFQILDQGLMLQSNRSSG
jgi:archaellum biogenesis ATPase FlaH